MIEVGEYVRFDDGDILKICGKLGKSYVMEPSEGNNFTLPKIAVHKDMVKHSKNIKDLIEVGDYINGSKLLSIDYAEDKFGNCDKLHFYYSFEDDEKDVNEYYESLKIKSIVTKEQFKNIEYIVED